MRPSKNEIDIVYKLRDRDKIAVLLAERFISSGQVLYYVDGNQLFTTCVVIIDDVVRAGSAKRVTHRGWKPDPYNEQTGRDIAFARAMLAAPQRSGYVPTNTGYEFEVVSPVGVL